MKMKPFVSFGLALAAFAFVGCDDNDNTNDVNNQNDARVLVTHAVSDAPPVNLVINNGATPAASGLTYGNSTGYLNVPVAPSPTNVKVTVPSLNNAAVVDANVPLEARVSYSAFATGRATSTPPAVAPIVVVDNLTAPATGKAHVRFFHFASGVPAVTVGTGTGTAFQAVFLNRAQDTQASATANQNFTPVDAGTYTFEVRVPSLSNAVALTVPNITLQNGKIYTIYASGVLNGTGINAVRATVITHN